MFRMTICPRRDGLRPAGLVALVIVAAVALGGCRSRSFDAATATELARPHLQHFATFDSWARRTLVADPAIRNRAALEETLFAPIRREEPVLGAWVERDGAGDTFAFGHLPGVPDLAYRVVRDRALGEILVATEKVPDPRAPFVLGGLQPQAVVLRMTREHDDGLEVTVTVAYRALR